MLTRPYVSFLKYYLASLESVGGKLTAPWEALAHRRQANLDTAETIAALRSETQPAGQGLALEVVPALHVDEDQRTLWRIAELLAHLDERDLSLIFSRTAHHTHQILIGGGADVFQDRWGPVTAEEAKSLEWLSAWNIWTESLGPSVQ